VGESLALGLSPCEAGFPDVSSSKTSGSMPKNLQSQLEAAAEHVHTLMPCRVTFGILLPIIGVEQLKPYLYFLAQTQK